MSFFLRTNFLKDNLLLYKSYSNLGTAQNVDLYASAENFSRYIFSLDLTVLRNYYDNEYYGDQNLTEHTIKIKTNIDAAYCRRNKIPTYLYALNQDYDEGCGNAIDCTNSCFPFLDRLCQESKDPSNWYEADFDNLWQVSGGVDTLTGEILTISDYYIDNDENVYLTYDVTSYINNIILNTQINTLHFLVSLGYEAEYLNNDLRIIPLYTKDTETFFRSFMESYDLKTVIDDRDSVVNGDEVTLFLNAKYKGSPIVLDEPPVVDIYNSSDQFVTSVQAAGYGGGFYGATFTLNENENLCENTYYDNWSNILYNGNALNDYFDNFFLQKQENIYSFNDVDFFNSKISYKFRGITEGQRIKAGENKFLYVDLYQLTDFKKKKIYSNNLYYRIYVMQGQNRLVLTDWIKFNQAFCQNFTLLDTSWMPEQHYGIDIRNDDFGVSMIYDHKITFFITD